MPNVTMPDGTVVAMPDQLDPALGARLRSFHDQQAGIASGQAHGLSPEAATAAEHAGTQIAGIGDALGTGILNIPHGFEHGARDLLSKISGNPAGKDIIPAAHLGPNGQALVKDLQDPAGAQNPEAKVQPGGPAGGNNATVQDVSRIAGEVGNDAANMAPGVALAKGAVNGVRAGLAAMEPETTAGGLVGQRQNALANTMAGPSGVVQRTLQNQPVGNTIAARDIAHPEDVPLTPQSVRDARAPANAVYNRAANSLQPMALTDDKATAAAIANAGSDGRISTGTPQAQAMIGKLKSDLLNGQSVTGDQVVSELSGLRQDAYSNLGAEDVDKRTLGKAQLGMANALEDHIARNLPANAPVSLDQLQAARTLLAKNSTVAGALKGNDVDMAALGRIHGENPGLLTGGLAHIAQFAAENPTVSGLANKISDARIPSVGHDITDINLASPASYVRPVVGGLGRRMVAGSADANMAKANAAFPPRGTADLAPLPNKQLALPQASMGPPTPGQNLVNAGGGATTATTLADELGMTPGTQAAAPLHPAAAREGAPDTSPEPRSMPDVEFQHPIRGDFSLNPQKYPHSDVARHAEDIPLADLLSGGVEQHPAAGLSTSPMGLEHPGGIPFTLDPSFMSRGMSLADELSPASRANNGDVAGVRSQGVPENIVARSETSTPNMEAGDYVEPPPNKFKKKKPTPLEGG